MTQMFFPECDVVVAGEYFCDLIFSGLDETPRLGADMFAKSFSVMPGGTYNMALALARLGVDAHWAVTFGTDLFSRLVRESAERDGISDRLFHQADHGVERVSAAFSLQGDRGFVSYSEVPVAAPGSETFDLARPRWLLQTFRFDPDWLDFVASAKAHGTQVFVDARHGDFTLETPGVADLLAMADVFSPNEDEALALTGAETVPAAIERLAGLVPVVIVKRGALGASVSAHGFRFDVAAPVVGVVDTVGAGDAFNAGFLFGMANGCPINECVRLAVLCGTRSVTAPGSSGVPTIAELIAFDAAQGGDDPAGQAALAALGRRRGAAFIS